jgi:membrane-bound serine protease (ClpP class)
MEVVIIISAIAVGLLLVELMLPTGGVLAFIGAAGLIGAGIVALGNNDEHADAIGGGLIAAGVLSIVAFAVVSRKVLDAHKQPKKGGADELVGSEGDVRTSLDPEGQIFVDGALWRARAKDGSRIEPGNRVRIDSVDGLTLLVEPTETP